MLQLPQNRPCSRWNGSGYSETLNRHHDGWLDAERTEALRQGEDAAWEEFAFHYHPVLLHSLRLAYFQVNKSFHFPPVGRSLQILMDDALSFFFERFTKRFQEFQGEKAFRAFLFITIRHFVADEGRKQR